MSDDVADVAPVEPEAPAPAPAATSPDALAAAVTATAEAAAPAAPPAEAPKKKRRARWRNPELDGERATMRADLDDMLAEARDPFADGDKISGDDARRKLGIKRRAP